MKKLIALLFMLMVVASPAWPDELAKKRDIIALLEMTGVSALSKQAADPMLSQSLRLLRQAYPQLSQKALDLFREEFTLALDEAIPEMMNEVMRIYDQQFSHREIRDMIAFYETDTGQKVIRTLPEITRQSMLAGNAWGQKYGRLAAERALQRLRDEGYRL